MSVGSKVSGKEDKQQAKQKSNSLRLKWERSTETNKYMFTKYHTQFYLS